MGSFFRHHGVDEVDKHGVLGEDHPEGEQEVILSATLLQWEGHPSCSLRSLCGQVFLHLGVVEVDKHGVLLQGKL